MRQIYTIKNTKTGEEELYRADSKSKASAHAASIFVVKVASQDDLERLLTAGVKVQEVPLSNPKEPKQE